MQVSKSKIDFPNVLYERKYNKFVIPQGYTQYVLMSNTECKQKLYLFTRKIHRAPLIL